MIIMGTRLGDFLSLFVRPLLTSFFSNPTAWIRSGGGVPLPVQPKQRPLAVRLRKRREAVSRLGPSGRRTPKKKRITAHRVYPQREEESRAELPSSPILPAFQLWLNENLKTPPPRRLYSHGDTRSKRRAMDRAAREARQSLSRGVPCMSHLTFFHTSSPVGRSHDGMGRERGKERGGGCVYDRGGGWSRRTPFRTAKLQIPQKLSSASRTL